MEEEFEREGFHKYIVFKTSIQSNDLRMLAENQIDGVLVHQLKSINGRECLYYQIEGCQPISIVFGQRLWDYTALKSLFQEICECILMLREYLLPLDALLLDSEHIYWSWQQERTKFLVVPDYDMPISQQLTGLTEYLMQHVDYKDKRASDWLYRFYDALRKQGGSYKLLCDFCRENSSEKMLIASEEEEIPKLHDRETEQALQEMYYMGESKWRQGFTKCVEWLKGIWRDKNAEKKTEIMIMNNCEPAGLQVEDFEADLICDSATTLLSEESHIPRLKPIDTGYPYIVPQKQSMLIGRQETSCNYVLPCGDISRVHASIILSDEYILVTDLNSSNGTYVNQKRLGIQESMIVRQGDEVCFGSVRYVAV